MDGLSLLPHLQGRGETDGHDTVYAEYTGEGTIRPLMMIRRGKWKYVTCPADGSQLFNLERDPLELRDLAKILVAKKKGIDLSGGLNGEDDLAEADAVFEAFEAEARAKWDFERITEEVLYSQRKRRLVWAALKQGKFTSWDYNPQDDGREK